MQTKGEYTPGPWGSFYDGEEVCTVGGGESIAQMLCYSDGRHKANARLIAAAPELLEALEAFNVTERMMVSGTADSLTIRVPIATIQRAAAAIARAKGLPS